MNRSAPKEPRGIMSQDTLKLKITECFNKVYREMLQAAPPSIEDTTVLLDSGLDSLGFTILVSNLEDELGYDPFQISSEAFYPVTFLEFVEFYDKNAPQ